MNGEFRYFFKKGEKMAKMFKRVFLIGIFSFFFFRFIASSAWALGDNDKWKNGKSLAFVSDSLSLFGNEPLLLVYFDGVIPLLYNIRAFFYPLITSSLFDRAISQSIEGLSEQFGRKFSSLEDFLSFAGLSPKVPVMVGLFETDVRDKGKFPYELVAFISLRNRKNFLNFFSSTVRVVNKLRCQEVQRELQFRLYSYLQQFWPRGRRNLSEKKILSHVLATKIPSPCHKLKWTLSKDKLKIIALNWKAVEKSSNIRQIYKSDKLAAYELGGDFVLFLMEKLAIFSFSMDGRKFRIKLAKKLSESPKPASISKLFIYPLGSGDIYGYFHLGRLSKFSRDTVKFASNRKYLQSNLRKKLINLVKNINDRAVLFRQTFFGLEWLSLKFSIGKRGFSFISSRKYGKKRSKLVDKIFRWKSRPLASKTLLPSTTVFLFSLNHLELLLSLYKDFLDSVAKNIEKFLLSNKASQFAMLLPTVATSLDQSKKYLKGELTVSISYSKRFIPQLAIFISSPDPSNTLKSLSPFIFRFFPQFTSKSEVYRGVSFSVLKKNPNASKNTKPFKLPLENRLAWGAVGNYAVITYQLEPGLSFIKSIIDRAASPKGESTRAQRVLRGNADLSLLLDFKNVHRFLEGAGPSKSMIPYYEKVKYLLSYLDYFLLKSENKSGKFYQYKLIFKKN